MGSIDTLFEIIRKLRGPNGCPWDQEQTPESMWKCLVEEVYELQEGIVKDNLSLTTEELGDVLFQLVFIIEMYQETNRLTLDEVVGYAAEKMIRRHPHVFEDAHIESEKELDDQWERIKSLEATKAHRKNDSALDRVPKGMPALMRALNVSKCAVKAGFDWDDIHGVIATVRDELDEFEAALKRKDQAEMNLEFGDILFSLVNVARFAKIYPENALAGSTAKFEGRFRIMEKALADQKTVLKDLPREKIDQLWESAKKDYDR